MLEYRGRQRTKRARLTSAKNVQTQRDRLYRNLNLVIFVNLAMHFMFKIVARNELDLRLPRIKIINLYLTRPDVSSNHAVAG